MKMTSNGQEVILLAVASQSHIDTVALSAATGRFGAVQFAAITAVRPDTLKQRPRNALTVN